MFYVKVAFLQGGGNYCHLKGQITKFTTEMKKKQKNNKFTFGNITASNKKDKKM